MSVAGLLISSILNPSSPTTHTPKQQFQQEFQQLGKDLQAGDLSAAQSDLATLQQSGAQPRSTLLAKTDTTLASAASQLSQDLQSGNLSAAQQDYSNILQDLQSRATQPHAHHHHGGGGSNPVAQALDQLGQALQSGSLSAAQQAYGALQQDVQQFAQNQAVVAGQTAAASGGVSVTA